MRTLDPLSLKFAIFARSVHRETLDMGCGNGLATVAVVERGGYVLAVDSDPRMLESVRGRIPPAQQSRLRTALGSLPHIDFETGSFAAIHAAHVLSPLSAAEADQSLRKMLDWLRPDGKLFLSSAAPADDLRVALYTAGFVIEEIEPYVDPDEPGVCCGVVARSACQKRAGSRSRATRP